MLGLLDSLRLFASGLDPQTTGLAVTSVDWLREAHNALSPPSAISLDGLGLPKKTEDAYHFIVYLPVLGAVYELDGLKRVSSFTLFDFGDRLGSSNPSVPLFFLLHIPSNAYVHLRRPLTTVRTLRRARAGLQRHAKSFKRA